MMTGLIRFALSNFTLTFLVLGLIAAGVSLARHPRPWGTSLVVEKILAWFIFFPIGAMFFYNFVMHVFFGEMAARFIGWQDSPFQFEVGVASLGFSLLGFLAFRGDFSMRVAAVAGSACFMAWAGLGHIYQMAAHHNFAPGNAGVIFYSDFLVPLLGAVLLVLQRRHSGAPVRR